MGPTAADPCPAFCVVYCAVFAAVHQFAASTAVLLEHGPAAAHTVTAAKPGSAKAACQAMAPSARYVETDLRPLRLM
jgi:hypothetical protein